MAARRNKADSEKMEENGVCKPMDLCRKDKWGEESGARGNVSGRGGVWPRGELRWIRESGAQGRK